MKTVQARLDEESQAALNQLTRRFGWTPSQVVREGLRLLIRQHGLKPHGRKKKIAGLGEFDSGVTDLGSNKAYLEDLGQ